MVLTCPVALAVRENGMNKTEEGHCELCGRFATTLSEHHLIPRTTHGNKRMRKMFSREEMKTRLADLCQPCNKAVHTFFTEKELALVYNTLEALKAHPAIQKHIVWVRNQKPDHRMKGKRMGQKERQW